MEASQALEGGSIPLARSMKDQRTVSAVLFLRAACAVFVRPMVGLWIVPCADGETEQVRILDDSRLGFHRCLVAAVLSTANARRR